MEVLKKINPKAKVYLKEGTEGAHEVREVPPLKKSRLELERDGEQPDDDVGQGQVGDKEVRHRLK